MFPCKWLSGDIDTASVGIIIFMIAQWNLHELIEDGDDKDEDYYATSRNVHPAGALRLSRLLPQSARAVGQQCFI